MNNLQKVLKFELKVMLIFYITLTQQVSLFEDFLISL